MMNAVERAIYRIARKHAGDRPKGWTCRVSLLHDKSGSESPLKQFNYMLKRIVEANALPDYELSFVSTNDNAPAVHFVRRGAAERAQVKADLEAESARRSRMAMEDARATAVDAMLDRRRTPASGDQ